ncbi:LamG-like jellyroll fold domain-containing protein [Pedobacter sp. HDW13]|uniref:LamG-like jellyroll fold domain-containing protein n=1 Tax=Pedobacter sp. HDW13 TaxID=2714940 RepID=UPI001980109B|nr:LamG-like jellyroll fold domain-containing protein [Pedobacter sp. HDW13]
MFNGDTWLDLNQVGVFSRSEPFSIGLWVNIPKQLTEGVIFHKGNSERLYNFRGYHLYLKNNRLELNMAHTAPSNALTRLSIAEVPRNKWVQLTVTYDGSSKAGGTDYIWMVPKWRWKPRWINSQKIFCSLLARSPDYKLVDGRGAGLYRR